MATYTFLAKRGQHNEVARLLADYIGKPKMSAYFGPRGLGVLLSLELPKDWSKRKVDKLLAMCAIPGAKKPTNRAILTHRQIEQQRYCDHLVDAGKVIPGKRFKWRDWDGKLYTAYVEYDTCFDQPSGYFLFVEDKKDRRR